MDGAREELVVYLKALDDVHGEDVLKLHDILVEQLRRQRA